MSTEYDVTLGLTHNKIWHPHYTSEAMPFADKQITIVCLSLSADKWSIPTTTGPRPPPCESFSFTAVSDHLTVLFGGLQLGHGGRVNNVYLIDFDIMVGQVFLRYNNLKLECSLTERDKVVQAMQWMQWTTSSNLQAIVEVRIYKCIVSLVPGVDQTGEASGSPLAIRENIPFCLLPQLWAGSPTGASHWGRRYD